VRNLEIRFVHRDPVDPQNVDVEGAWPPPFGAHTFCCGFKPLAHPQKFTRRQVGIDLDDEVEERPLA
jgi:hypothetical protein